MTPALRCVAAAALSILSCACGVEAPPTTGPVPAPAPQGPPPEGAFGEAMLRFERESGARARPSPDLEGCREFSVPTERVERSLAAWTREYLKGGAYLYRRESGFGREPDVLVLMPTTDKFVVLERMQTDGINHDHTHEDVMAWLRAMDAKHPFLLTGAGLDFVEGEFEPPPKAGEAAALAKSIYEFCPDVVDQGVSSVDALAAEIRKGRLYLWWD